MKEEFLLYKADCFSDYYNGLTITYWYTSAIDQVRENLKVQKRKKNI